MDQSQVNELLADDLCFNVSVFRLQLCRTDSSDCELEDVDLVQFLVCQEKLDEELEDSDKKIAASIPGSDEHDAAVKEKKAVTNKIFRYKRAHFKQALDTDLLYFPPSVTRDNVVHYVNDAAKKQQLGFEVVMLRSAPRKNVKEGVNSKDASNRILLGCSRGIKHRDRSAKRSTNSTSTKPRTNADLCRQQFPVYERVHDGRMFIRRNGGCSWRHNHPNECYVHTGVRALPDETREKVVELLRRGVPTSSIKELVDVEAGIELSSTAINALKYRVELSASNKGKGVPTATELLAELDAREDVDYVVLKGSYDEALDKVRINKQRRKKKGGKVELNESCEVKDLGEEADDSVKNVVKGLSLGNGEYLIAVAWVTAEGRVHHMKYPFLLGYDETFRTNAEKRPLARLCGMTLDHKLLCFVEAFLPSKQKWVLNWLWRDVYPVLLDKPSLKKTQCIKVDQDEHNWLACTSNIEHEPYAYGDAIAGLCNWHKINRNFTVKVIKCVDKSNESDCFFFDEVEKWFYSFTYNIMNKEQEFDSMSKLLAFVDMAEGVCSKNLVKEVRNYIRTSFELDLYRLSFRHYKDVGMGYVAGNSFSESYNALTYKAGQGAIKSNNKLDKAAKKLLTLSSKRFSILRSNVQSDLNVSQVARKGKLVDQAEIDLSKDVVPRMVEKSIEQWEQGRRSYKCCDPMRCTIKSQAVAHSPAQSPVKVGSKRSSNRTPSGQFRHPQNRKIDSAIQAGNVTSLTSNTLDGSPAKTRTVSIEDSQSGPQEYLLAGPPSVCRTVGERTILVRHSEKSRVYSHVYPVYHMTHTLRIRLIEIDGKEWWCIVCDCDYFKCHKCPCRHIYCYIERKPIVSDFYPEATKLYAMHYAETGKEKYTAFVDRVRRNLEANGGVLVPKETLENLNGVNMIDDLASFLPKSMGGDAPADPFDANGHKDCINLSELTEKPSLQPSTSGVRHRGGMASKHKMGTMNPYTEYLPLYESSMKLVPQQKGLREAAHEAVVRNFNNLHQDLYALSLGDNRMSSSVARDGQLSSLPAMETAPMRKNYGNMKGRE